MGATELAEGSLIDDLARDRQTQANKTTNTANYPDKPLNQYDAPEQTWWNEHDLPMSEVNQ